MEVFPLETSIFRQKKVHTHESLTISAHLAGILLFVDDQDGVFLSLPLRINQSLLHLRPLGSDHLEGLLLGLGHRFLDLIHGLTLHLIHSLFYTTRGRRVIHP